MNENQVLGAGVVAAATNSLVYYAGFIPLLISVAVGIVALITGVYVMQSKRLTYLRQKQEHEDWLVEKAARVAIQIVQEK